MGRNESHTSRSRNALTPLASLLEETRAQAAKQSGQTIDRETWRQLLGERIAKHSSPLGLRGKVLTIAVESGIWAQELSFLGSQIIERLRAARYNVSELRWTVKAVTHRDLAQAPAGPPAVVPLARLPQELESTISAVRDVELRNAIRQAAAHMLARQEENNRHSTATARPQVSRVPRSSGPEISQPGPTGSAPHEGSPRTNAKPRG